MKKSVVKKIKQSCKGAMSIFLCVLVTPFVSIACGLVEVYRYQGAVQTYRDVVDATQFSSLANSDEYLKDRFGLFAMSQQEDDDVFKNFINDLNDNLSILGNAITTGDTKANGKNPLSEPDVLKTQIKDNAEINVPVNMLKDIVGSTGVMEKIENRFSDETKEKFEKKMFKEDAVKRRCIIPISGFYEWDRAHAQYRFTNNHILYLAGIYHDDYFTILTKEAEDIMSGIHSRMPVIVSFEDIDLWLDEGRVYKKTKDSLEVLGSHKQMSLDDISDINP